jgi:hypothetical protein
VCFGLHTRHLREHVLPSLAATCQVCVVSLKAGQSTYNWRAGDGVQRPLRSRCPPRLTPGVGRFRLDYE